MSSKSVDFVNEKRIMIEVQGRGVGNKCSTLFCNCKNNLIRSKKTFGVHHLALLTIVGFWLGVVFTHYIIDSSKLKSVEVPARKYQLDVVLNNDQNITNNIGLITRAEKIEDNEENLTNKKLILLHGKDVWTKYDKWRRFNWRRCPPKWSNCRITTDHNRLGEVDAVVYNAEQMPDLRHVEETKSDSSVKKVFLSGITPRKTTFNPEDFSNFFDTTITYKGDSNIRIPFWPNDGLLPAMYRPKSPGRKVEGEEMLDLEEEISNYFVKFGKEDFMAYVIKNCSNNHYPTLFVNKLRDEGKFLTYSLNDSSQCLSRIRESSVLPCSGVRTDDCVKHFEKFKFIIVTDEDLCIDYTSRDYWLAIFAWQSVPLLYGASNYKKYLIPNTYVDCVGDEDYIAPAFKKAYAPSQDSKQYYKQFQLWRHEDRVEEFHWQCELCKELNTRSKHNTKVDMVKFWNKDQDCGAKVKAHELMRLQLVRTGVISG